MPAIVKIINRSQNDLPSYATPHSAGVDLRADLPYTITLSSGDRTVIPTGLFLELPEGYEAQVRPRSGLAAKYGITVLNSPGTIDADYRGEVKVILINHGHDAFDIAPGERIAQLVFKRYEQVQFVEAPVLSDTERSKGGFGHTGTE